MSGGRTWNSGQCRYARTTLTNTDHRRMAPPTRASPRIRNSPSVVGEPKSYPTGSTRHAETAAVGSPNADRARSAIASAFGVHGPIVTIGGSVVGKVGCGSLDRDASRMVMTNPPDKVTLLD